MLYLLLVLGCAKEPAPAPEPPPAPADVAPPPASAPLIFGEAAPDGGDTVLPPVSAEAALAMCRARVEGASTDGECKVDTDCSRAGCSQEVCVPAAVAPTLNTTCEKLPCFADLDTCGCVSGVCAWTWKNTP